MKFIHYSFLFICTFAIGCYTPSTVYQPAPSPVKFQFEEGSKVIEKNYCTSLEKTSEGLYVFKRYYPTTSVLTEQISFKDKDMLVRHGQKINYYDDGTLWKSFTYENNVANGKAEENGAIGQCKDGFRFGNWQKFRDGVKIMSYNYNEKGVMHGPDTSWTQEGELAAIRQYENGKMVDENIILEGKVDRFEVVEKMPLFISENCTGIENDSLKKVCADKAMLTHIYSNIKYPSFAVRNEIEGVATLSFVVDKDGSISDVKALNGVCDEIKAECLRIVNGFTTWQPGYQKGEPVRVQFNLPVRFRLE